MEKNTLVRGTAVRSVFSSRSSGMPSAASSAARITNAPAPMPMFLVSSTRMSISGNSPATMRSMAYVPLRAEEMVAASTRRTPRSRSSRSSPTASPTLGSEVLGTSSSSRSSTCRVVMSTPSR